MGLGLATIDQRICTFMRRMGPVALRLLLGVIFVWFGILKPFGVSPAENLVKDTVRWIPILEPATWVIVIGCWEVAIGMTFLFRKTTRIAIAMLFVQMVGTLMPLVLLPQTTFAPGLAPFVPSLEGQYIIKNLLIISAAMVLGGAVGRRQN